MYSEKFFTDGHWHTTRHVFSALQAMLSEMDENDVDVATLVKSIRKLTGAMGILVQIVDDSRAQLLKERGEHGKGV